MLDATHHAQIVFTSADHWCNYGLCICQIMAEKLKRETSLYLDIARPVAALMVLLGHLAQSNLTGGSAKLLDTAGGSRPPVFFVLSGLVIAFVTTNRERDARTYFVSRASRIYSVALPVILLTFVLDSIGSSISPDLYLEGVQPFTFGGVVRAITFIGEIWNEHRFPGSDGPYWTLGFEVWYYIAFGTFAFVPGVWRWPATALVLAFIGPKVAVLFPLWLLGVALYHIITKVAVSRVTGWVLLVASALTLILYETADLPFSRQFMRFEFSAEKFRSLGQDYLVGTLFAVHMFGFNTVAETFQRWLQSHLKVIRWISGATFSLYLAHLPIIYFLAAISPFPRASILHVLFLGLGGIVGCLLFAEVSERRKPMWRNFVLRILVWIDFVAVLVRRSGKRLRTRSLVRAGVIAGPKPKASTDQLGAAQSTEHLKA